MQVVKTYLSSLGYNCKDVSRRGGEYEGFDILAQKGSVSLKVEVKGSSNESGIPDCYVNEFDVRQRLIADFIYIARFDHELRLKRIEVLSKKEVDRYAKEHVPLRRIRIAPKLKTDLKNGRIGKILPVL